MIVSSEKIAPKITFHANYGYATTFYVLPEKYMLHVSIGCLAGFYICNLLSIELFKQGKRWHMSET